MIHRLKSSYRNRSHSSSKIYFSFETALIDQGQTSSREVNSIGINKTDSNAIQQLLKKVRPIKIQSMSLA